MPIPLGYDGHDVERWVVEPPRDATRTPFARDRARVVHSSGLRRLGAKTQVVTPWSDDFVRNRLTHSLEVGQVGRELGRALGCDPDVVETACLAHDLGHPPFGHNGERALDEVSAGIGGFEGNAQTLRMLTRLEAKAFATDGRSVGLNLTRASLDATTKYPWFSTDPYAAAGKFGAYAEDSAVFSWLRTGAPDRTRCIEAQVMDWADDVAYSVHDLEDGLQGALIDLRALSDPHEVAGIALLARDQYAVAADPAALEDALRALTALPEWPDGYDGSLRALAALKRLTSALVGRFCRAAEAATREVAGTGQLTRYASDLLVPERTRHEVAALKAVAARYVMQAEGRRRSLDHQRTLLAQLVAAILERPDMLARSFHEDWSACVDDAARLRVAVDAVSSLTDTSAIQMASQVRGS